MPGQTESFWVTSCPGRDFPSLRDEVSVDVCVVGGGIVGVTAATMLKDQGKTVALVDARRFVQGATGYTTAKLTSSHNLIYDHLVKSFGLEGARIYGEANESGIDWIEKRCGTDSIECGFERKANYVYSEDPNKVVDLKAEAKAAGKAGLPASFVTEVDLPFPVAGAVRFEHQAQFHPRRFLLPLAEKVVGDGSHVFAHTTVTGLSGSDPIHVDTASGGISADDVVIATHLPILDRGLFFAKAHPFNSYAIAGEIDPAAAPSGMYISTGGSTRSIRSIPNENKRLLMIGGAGHKVGRASPTSARYEELEEFGLRWWDIGGWPHRWSTHDYVSVDRVPFIGRFSRTSDHVFVATAFGKWGLAAGVAAAMIITDAIVGRSNPWAEFFDAKRVNVHQLKEAVVENAQIGARFLLDRAPHPRALSDLELGAGAIVSSGLNRIAAYKDESGYLHAFSAVCTHLGCIVQWNDGDRTWDCPCHGSRFDHEGHVVNGPAIRDLKPIDTEED